MILLAISSIQIRNIYIILPPCFKWDQDDIMLIVFVGGASASGKTEIALGMKETLNKKGIKTLTFSMDNYYKSLKERDGKLIFDTDIPDAFNWDLFEQQLKMAEQGQSFEMPKYSFEVKDRLKETETINPKGVRVIIIEGILALHRIKEMQLQSTMAFFVETDSYLSIIKRRIPRDQNYRSTPPQETKMRERTMVGPAFFTHILGTKKNADVCLLNNDGKSKDGKTGQERAIEEAISEMMKRFPQLFKDEVEEKSCNLEEPEHKSSLQCH